MSAKPCPICAKPAVEAHRPFCSRRCADVDLQRWFAGSYVVPGASQAEDEGARDEAERDDQVR